MRGPIYHEPESLRIVLDQIERKTWGQLNQADALSLKAVVVIGINIFTAAQVWRARPLDAWLIGGTMILLMAILFALLGYMTAPYRYDPHPSGLYKGFRRGKYQEYGVSEHEALVHQLCVNLVECFVVNEAILQGKVRIIRAAIWLTCLGLVWVFVGFFCGGILEVVK